MFEEEQIEYDKHLAVVKEWDIRRPIVGTLLMCCITKSWAVKVGNFLRQHGYIVTITAGTGPAEAQMIIKRKEQ